MPYIKQDYRKQIDDKINDLCETVFREISPNAYNGVANYIITRILLNILEPTSGWSYDSLSDVIKTLECSKLEIIRRLLSPYEDKYIEKNGDLEEFQT